MSKLLLPVAILVLGTLLASIPGYKSTSKYKSISGNEQNDSCPGPGFTEECSGLDAIFPTFTHTATEAGGVWNDAGTWIGGVVPGDDAIVHIPTGTTVTINHQDAARIKYIKIDGTLELSATSDTRLMAETIYVANGGYFKALGINPGKTAEIIFINDGQPITALDPCERLRGFLSDGKVRVTGTLKTPMVDIASNVDAGSTTVNLTSMPADWQVGDSVVLAGTYFLRDTINSPIDPNLNLQDEKFKIEGVAGNTLTVSPATQYNHYKNGSDLVPHAAHLTRNVIFRSELSPGADPLDPSMIPLRGHMMFMSGDVDIRYAAFINLGRTDKREPLDDVCVNEPTGEVIACPQPPTNRRGRYAVHFHENGINTLDVNTPLSKVYGCVVQGTPGWGFVSHSSHVDFRHNVCHDFVGAAFVTEAGDELGNFFNNIAIHGRGDGVYRTINVFKGIGNRELPASDFGFTGDGFWFQGPAIRAKANVASSCNGAGMIWFTTGGIEPGANRFTGFNRTIANSVYGAGNIPQYARNWNYDQDALVIADLPILECNNFQAYGCLVGFRLRFNNHPSFNSFYGSGGYNYEKCIDTAIAIKDIDYARQSVETLKLWNNEIGFNVRYNRNTDWENIEVNNRLDYHFDEPMIGAEFFNSPESQVFTNLTIFGYAVAGLKKATVQKANGNIIIKDNTNQITLINENYTAYAQADSWIVPEGEDPTSPSSCPRPENLYVDPLLVTVNSAVISWQNSDVDSTQRFMVRYKKVGAFKWLFVMKNNPGANEMTLTGLSPNTSYVYQVIAGCEDTLSWWSAERDTFTTAAEELAKSVEVLSDTKERIDQQLTVYPVPAGENELYIQLNEPIAVKKIEVYDLLGRLRMEKHINEITKTGKLDVSHLKPGEVYLLKIYSTDDKPIVRRFLR